MTQDILHEIELAMQQMNKCSQLLQQLYSDSNGIVSDAALRNIHNLSKSLDNHNKGVEFVHNRLAAMKIL